MNSYRLNESESSEDELYSKQPPPSGSAKAEAVPLLKINQPVRSPAQDQTLAEWAVNNMCHNPGKVTVTGGRTGDHTANNVMPMNIPQPIITKHERRVSMGSQQNHRGSVMLKLSGR